MRDKKSRDPAALVKLGSGARRTRSDRPTARQYEALLAEPGPLNERYRATGFLGSGGMGEVHRWFDHKCERAVAVKKIDASVRDEFRRRRFLREARIQAQLDHPTIAPVYDIGVDDSGCEYFTMKQALGRTLEVILEGLHYRDEPVATRFTLPVRLGIFRQICQGVEYAHSRGIVHRDLKPDNVMVGEHGETYILDWGIAKVLEAGSPTLNASEHGAAGPLGTPGYMAPEQIQDAEHVGPAADVYALGAILYELLTIAPLHPQEDVDEVVASTCAGVSADSMIATLAEHDVAPELVRACVLATRADPAERLQSVTPLLAMVSAYLDGDRDWRLRRELAAEHATTAARALSELLERGDADGRLRAVALQEAGHALVLDPKCAEAVRVLTELLANPPTVLPSEAEEILEEQREERAIMASNGALAVYAALIPLGVSLLLLVEIRNWLAVAAMIVPLLGAVGINRFYALRLKRKAPALPITCAVLCAIAATSTLGGPFLIMPALLAGFATVSMAHTDDLIDRPWTWASCTFVAAAVPVLLHAMGMLPVVFDIQEAGRIFIQHQVSDASPAVMWATLTGALALGVFGPMFFGYRAARLVLRARREMAVQMWHLHQLTARPDTVRESIRIATGDGNTGRQSRGTPRSLR